MASSLFSSELLLSFLCVSLASVTALSPYNDMCAVDFGSSSYVLSSMQGKELILQPYGSWRVYLNLCSVTKATPACAEKNAMLCAVHTATNETYAIVNPFPNSYYDWSALPNGAGVVLTAYGQPAECPYDKTVIPTASFLVLCNPGVLRKPFLSTFNMDPYSCVFTTTLYHAQGCGLSSPVYPTPQPSSDNAIPQNVSIGITIALGVVILAVFIVLVVCGCRRGCCRCCCHSDPADLTMGLLDIDSKRGEVPYSAPAPLANAPADGCAAASINI